MGVQLAMSEYKLQTAFDGRLFAERFLPTCKAIRQVRQPQMIWFVRLSDGSKFGAWQARQAYPDKGQGGGRFNEAEGYPSPFGSVLRQVAGYSVLDGVELNQIHNGKEHVLVKRLGPPRGTVTLALSSVYHANSCLATSGLIDYALSSYCQSTTTVSQPIYGKRVLRETLPGAARYKPRAYPPLL